MSASNMTYRNLTWSEPAGTTLSLGEFIRKYIQGKPIGFVLSDTDYANSVKWYVKIKDGVSICPQEYMVFITKSKGSVDSAWSYISFVLFPCSGSYVYFVSYVTDNSASSVTMTVKRILLTTV